MILRHKQLRQSPFGKRGEEFVTILFQYAMDRVASRLQPPLSDVCRVPGHLSFIKVKDVLLELLGTEDAFGWTAEALEWADKHWFNFTHFRRLADDDVLVERFTEDSSLLLSQHWTRQAAVLRNHGQSGFEIAIPAYYSDGVPEWTERWEKDMVDVLVVSISNSQSPCIHLDGLARQDRSGRFVPTPQEGTRIRGFNLFLALALSPRTNLDISTSAMLGVSVSGATTNQFPVMRNLRHRKTGEDESGSLRLFLRAPDGDTPLHHDSSDIHRVRRRQEEYVITAAHDPHRKSNAVGLSDKTKAVRTTASEISSDQNTARTGHNHSTSPAADKRGEECSTESITLGGSLKVCKVLPDLLAILISKFWPITRDRTHKLQIVLIRRMFWARKHDSRAHRGRHNSWYGSGETSLMDLLVPCTRDAFCTRKRTDRSRFKANGFGNQQPHIYWRSRADGSGYLSVFDDTVPRTRDHTSSRPYKP